MIPQTYGFQGLMPMQHLQIAYELGVIMIGFVTLAIVVFWALRTQEAYLRDFCIVYALFTILLVIEVMKKYLSLNVADYSDSAWYVISGVYQVVNFAVIVATIHFFLGIFQIRSRKILMPVFLVLMLGCDFLISAPFGAVLGPEKSTIHLGVGFRIASIWLLISFTFALVLGYVFFKRVWRTDKQTFVLGLLLFATVGYGETFISVIFLLRNPVSVRSTESDFLFSSIPYALYGVFIISYFLHYYISTPAVTEGPSEVFLAKYAITEREREIILKVIQGKSNANIASELVISLATVKTHLHNIYKKTGVDSRYDLLARVRSDQ
jgi:DNA-binding CsgD family transcriptional regulator